MSVTKTLVHHPATTTTTTTAATLSRRFLLPSDDEDRGLVMRLDSKLEPALSKRAHGGSTPVPAKLCGQTKAVANWALFTWTHQIQKVTESIQRLLIRLLPVMLYTSLLVSLGQAGTVIYLLASAALPLGAWFLLGCLAIMCYFFVISITQQQQRASGSSSSSSAPSSATSPRRLSHSSSSSSSDSISPYTSERSKLL